MKVKVVLEVEVYDTDYLNTHGEETQPISQSMLHQYVNEELGLAFSSFSNVNLQSSTIVDGTVTKK